MRLELHEGFGVPALRESMTAIDEHTFEVVGADVEEGLRLLH